jgi:hypothetical protein
MFIGTVLPKVSCRSTPGVQDAKRKWFTSLSAAVLPLNVSQISSLVYMSNDGLLSRHKST